MNYWRILAICCILAAYLCVVFTADATTASSSSSGNETVTESAAKAAGSGSEPGVKDTDGNNTALTLTSSLIITALSTIIGFYL